MTSTAALGSNRIGFTLTLALAGLVGIALFGFLRTEAVASLEVTSTAAAKATQPSKNEADALSGIILARSITDQDAVYLRDNLQLLHDHLPAWWQYIREARPLLLAVDLEQGKHGRAAVTRCCESAGNYGVITFGLHFGELTASDDLDSQTAEARQITFMGILVHEATHVRDQRAGRFMVKTDRKTCIAGESSGLTKQLEFKRDLAAASFVTQTEPGKLYARVLSQQIQSETHDLHDRAFWDQYCGAFSS